MKPKPLLLKLALAAILLAAAAQQSPAPVIGYVNVVLSPGWSLLATPLLTTDYNANFVLTGSPGDGSLLYRFDPAIGSYQEAGTYLTGVGWYPLSGDLNDPALDVPPGEGFFIWSPQRWTNTFVGEVIQDSTNPIPANYSLKGSMFPQAGALQANLQFPAVTGDSIYSLSGTVWVAPTFSACSYSSGFCDPVCGVAKGFFVHAPAAQSWIQHFVIPGRASSKTSDPASQILSLTIRDGVATLEVSKTAKSYNVQFSTNRVDWTTIATAQTAATWKYALPPGPRGYFQVTQP